MSADWTTARVVRVMDMGLFMRTDDPMVQGLGMTWRDEHGALWTLRELHVLDPITPVLDAEGLPVVRTVGDLTARHVGRRVRLYDGPAFTLRGLQSFIRGELGDSVQLAAEWDGEDDWDYTDRLLDTPCEVLPRASSAWLHGLGGGTHVRGGAHSDEVAETLGIELPEEEEE